MTALFASGSEDIPLASVKNVGVTEVTSGLVILGAILTLLFGHDWGIGANAVEQAPKVIEVVTTALALARAIKHVGISHANAKVIAARPMLVPQQLGRHEAPAVGADLPTVVLSGDAGHVHADGLMLLAIVTVGVFLGGLVLHLVLT